MKKNIFAFIFLCNAVFVQSQNPIFPYRGNASISHIPTSNDFYVVHEDTSKKSFDLRDVSQKRTYKIDFKTAHIWRDTLESAIPVARKRGFVNLDTTDRKSILEFKQRFPNYEAVDIAFCYPLFKTDTFYLLIARGRLENQVLFFLSILGCEGANCESKVSAYMGLDYPLQMYLPDFYYKKAPIVLLNYQEKNLWGKTHLFYAR